MHDDCLEIERKFLVRHLPDDLARFPHRRVLQGYLARDRRTQVRLRRSGKIHSLTFKRDTPQGREEREIQITASQFARLWPATAGARLTKTRYDIAWKKWRIELDIYEGANDGIVVAEVEFPDRKSARAFLPPDWFGKEVTGIRRYSNIRLALRRTSRSLR